MNDYDLKRLSRLTAILTILQSKRLITAKELATKFDVSNRTIYRDIKALEQSGVPILTEEGKGYSLMEGYRIPPVMFTEREAFALVTAEKLIANEKDQSLRKEFTTAIGKIKAVLRNYSKEKTELIETSIFIGKNMEVKTTSNSLLDIQMAIASQQIVNVDYTNDNNQSSERTIEPYLLYHSFTGDWVLCAWCQLRKEFRSFRLDRINQYSIAPKTFIPDKKAFDKFIQKFF